MEKFKSHFVFNRQQRYGILFLILLISGFLGVYFFVDFSEENILDTNSPEIISFQKELDSLQKIEIANRKSKIYPFNPNFITDYKGYTLDPHRDDDRIKLALQIYLGDNNAGTSLFESVKSPAFHTFKYECNNGYALLNNVFSFHGTEFPVVNEVRKSMYVRYS